MSVQHLSDEAVAACADGVLSGHARARAMRHVAGCTECADAVREQREAAWVLRAAPAPALPSGLADRLRGLPAVTPLTVLPTVLAPDGTTMLATSGRGSLFGSSVAAFVEPGRSATANPSVHRARNLAATAAVLALAGVLATGAAVGPAGDESPQVVREPGQAGHLVDHVAPLTASTVPAELAPAAAFTVLDGARGTK